MLSPPAASSDKLWDSSSSSSDAGDVLVRSTRLLEAAQGSVRITVQKLRDAAGHPPLSEQHQQSSGTENQQRTKLQHKPDIAALLWAPADSQPGVCEDRRTLKKPGPTKENREPTGRQLLAAKSNPDRKLSAGTQSGQQPGHDLLTSRFAPGGRGVVLAALKQRSHSTPHRREVKVQLLDPGPFQGTASSQDAPAVRPSSQDAVGVQTDAQVSSGRLGDATNAAAAAAAAAVAAAAPLIKSQSDMEARVSQLADGVERLLQADREVVDRGRGMSQQTLQHLETLHSRQLQLQSQLLESALRIVTSHTTSTTSEPAKTFDLTASGQPACLQVTHLDAAANVLSNQQPSSLATREGTVETGPVSMATPRRDRWPKQTRDDRYRRGSPSFPRATQSADRSQLQSSANNGQAAARRANEVLKEMGRLKTEIEMLLTPEDSLNITPAQVPHQTQQNQSQNQQNQCQTHQNPHKTQQNQPQYQQNQSQENHPQTQQNHHQYQQNQSQENQSQIHQIQSRPVLVQRRPVVPSMLEEAGLVLRQVQRQKKVLEENLDSLLRAKTGEVLHCQLEALAANRDWTEEVRIKKTVDAWINTLSKDIQAEMSSEDTVRCRPADAASKHSSSRDPAVTSQQRAAGSRGPAHTGRGRPVNVLRGTENKKAGRESRGQTAGQRQGVEPVSEGKQVEVDGESYLTHLYGRAPYDGLRRTLKKSPYLRFSSPASPLGRKSRPRLVESVRGVKVKSCKTQTSLAPPVSSSPAQPQSCYIFSSSHLTPGDPSDLTVTPAGGHSVSMAIPLGRPRMESSSRCPPGERQQEMTSHPAPPTASVVAMDSKTPELHSQEEEQLDRREAPPPSSHTVEITESEEEDDEEDIFPGTNFLSVAEVVQEEVSVVGEEAVELDGRPSPPPVLYQGPVFPPQACSALPAQEQAFVLCPNPHRDALENRLVEWVEQQLMSRMISQMYRPPPADPVQNDSSDQSELEEHSFTSDIVEAAGGGGLQLFVDSSMSVDSALIRQLVNEVLTETVALMLGQREALGSEPRPEPLKPALHQEEKQVPLLPTPVPTPPSSPAQPSRGTTPLTTPPLSEPTSLLNEESPQPITAPELVATPTPSPEPTPSRGTPPAVHQVSSPLTWGDAELPLDEEKPEEYLDTHTQPLVMSVAEVEPPLSTPVLPPSPPPPPPVHRSPTPPPSPPAPDPRPPSSSSEDSSSSETSSSSSSSNSSSGSVVTAGTDAALKHISEGELLISVNQLAAMTEEEAVCSFSSSLQELQDMDFDPPSEGQVRGHDLLLTLLTKMEQGVTHTHRGERPQPEGSWGREEEEEEVSVGEVRDDQTTKPRKLTVNAMAAQCDQTSSPGQMLQSADVSEVSFEATNQGPVNLGELMVEPSGTLTSDLHSNLSLSPPPRLENTQTAGQVVLVRQYDTQTNQQQGGTRRMDVHLPSIIPVEEEMEESVSAAADSDSSTNDVF